MNKVTTKMMKIILFIAITFWHYFKSYQKTGILFSFKELCVGLAFGSLAFIGASLFGFTLELSRNYLIAFILTVAITLFCCFRLDGVIAAVPFLTDDIFFILLVIVVIICIVRDIIFIRNNVNYENH